MNNQDIVSQLKELTKVMTGAEEVPGDTVTDVVRFMSNTYQGGGSSGLKETKLNVQCMTNHSPYDVEINCYEQIIDDTHSILTVNVDSPIAVYDNGTSEKDEPCLNTYDLKENGTYDVYKVSDTGVGIMGNLICTYYEGYASGEPKLMTGVLSFNGDTATFIPSANGTDAYYGGIEMMSVSGILKKCPIVEVIQ